MIYALPSNHFSRLLLHKKISFSHFFPVSLVPFPPKYYFCVTIGRGSIDRRACQGHARGVAWIKKKEEEEKEEDYDDGGGGGGGGGGGSGGGGGGGSGGGGGGGSGGGGGGGGGGCGEFLLPICLLFH